MECICIAEKYFGLRPSTSNSIMASVAAPNDNMVFIQSDGSAVGFGYNGDVQCDVPDLPEGSQYVVVAARTHHSSFIC